MFKILRESDRKISNWSGGVTKELYIYPEDGNYQSRDFKFRISIATTELESSTFTKLENTNRVISILDGHMDLEHKNHHSISLDKYQIDRFKGHWDTFSKGKVTDFNLMIKNGNGDFFFKEFSKEEKINFPKEIKTINFIFCISEKITVDENELKQGEILVTDKKEIFVNSSEGKIFYGFAEIEEEVKMKDLWNGRFDSDEEVDLRLWQVIKEFDENAKGNGICFVGYNTDDGVERNQGRIGAKDGSNAIRKAMQSFPKVEGLEVYDYKNLSSQVLEEAQKEYSDKIANVLKAGLFPIGLGGGHDIAYGSYSGIRKAYPDKKIGLINFDTHLDIRPYDNGPTSGTSFKQILDSDKNAKYAIVGFKKQGNTKRLIDTAKAYNTLILDEEDEENYIITELQKYISSVDVVYITFCMDVFDAPYAPGVSAPTIMGLDPKKGKRILRDLMATGKVVCVDFAEVNPLYDIDSRTAKLAGCLAYDIMLNKSK